MQQQRSRYEFTPLENIIHKILRFMPKYYKQQIHQLITRNSSDTNAKLEAISKKVCDFVVSAKLKPDAHRQDFIVGKLHQYLLTKHGELFHDNMSMWDIGGGNGNVLCGLREEINKHYLTNKEDFVCIESYANWIEDYQFNNTNISYRFLERGDGDVNCEENSVDVVLCMVSLHHMSNETIVNMLHTIHRVLKPNGVVLIKEHDNKNMETDKLIMWEHYLYHILDLAYKGEYINTAGYDKVVLHNFKRKEEWSALFEKTGFQQLELTNRFLDGKLENDPKNATELYWGVYKVQK